ncbi:MAG TPA: cytochrome c maturation protein CcmE [Chloroflexota bacterium]|nr:cytochrome c maturation protein CcmE [Chloroflexota bacterium]
MRAQVLIPALVVIVAAGYLLVTAVRTTAVYYLTVGELKAAGSSIYDQPVRVAGNVVPGSIQRDPTSFETRFQASDASGVLPVSYHGVLPDIFGDGIEVVVEGKYEPDGTFVAGTLLAKCPSKFEGAT